MTVRPTSIEAYELAITPDGNRAEFATRAHYVEKGTNFVLSDAGCTANFDIVEYGLYAVDMRTGNASYTQRSQMVVAGANDCIDCGSGLERGARCADATRSPAIVPRDWPRRSDHERSDLGLDLSSRRATAAVARRCCWPRCRAASGAPRRARAWRCSSIAPAPGRPRHRHASWRSSCATRRRSTSSTAPGRGASSARASTARSPAAAARPCASAPSASSSARNEVLLVGVSQLGDVIIALQRIDAQARRGRRAPGRVAAAGQRSLRRAGARPGCASCFRPRSSAATAHRDRGRSSRARRSRSTASRRARRRCAQPVKVRAPATYEVQRRQERLRAVPGAGRRAARRQRRGARHAGARVGLRRPGTSAGTSGPSIGGALAAGGAGIAIYYGTRIEPTPLGFVQRPPTPTRPDAA